MAAKQQPFPFRLMVERDRARSLAKAYRRLLEDLQAHDELPPHYTLRLAALDAELATMLGATRQPKERDAQRSDPPAGTDDRDLHGEGRGSVEHSERQTQGA